MSTHRAHRRVRPARPAITGRVALSGAAVLALGTGPFVGLASAAPAVVEHGAGSAVAPVAASSEIGGGSDALWYGLLTTAAVAGAAGAHQLVGGRHRRRA